MQSRSWKWHGTIHRALRRDMLGGRALSAELAVIRCARSFVSRLSMRVEKDVGFDVIRTELVLFFWCVCVCVLGREDIGLGREHCWVDQSLYPTLVNDAVVHCLSYPVNVRFPCTFFRISSHNVCFVWLSRLWFMGYTSLYILCFIMKYHNLISIFPPIIIVS